MPTTTNLNTLTINHVASQEVYDAMAAQNLINENELYLVPGDISIATDDTPGGTENSEALITSGAAYAGFQTKANKQNAIYFVKGTQTAKTGSWRGVLSAVNELYDGLTIAYLLPVAGDGSATLTLELGNSVETAAEPIYYTGTSRLTTHYGAGSIILLTWVSNATTGYAAVDSATGSWRRADYDSTVTYRLTNYYGLYKAYTNLYRYQICLTKNETSVLPINTVSNSTATTKTLTTESFNPFGPIYYYNTTTTISANGNIGANTLAYQYLADLRYSFNTGTTLTARKAVYLIATLGEGCSATLKPGNQPITQTLPTTDDGYIYIYLGQAYDTYRIELSVHHPIYQYKNGWLRTVSADYMVNGHTVEADVPSNAAFTDTTYSFEGGNNGSIKVINNLTSAEQTVSIYSLPLATSAERGGVKIGYTANGKNYPVQLSNEKMYVNVPWTNVNDAYLTEDDVSPTLPTPTLAWGGTTTIGTVRGKEFKVTMPANPDTHYTTHLYATGASGTSNAETTNGNTKLRLFDNTTARESIGLTGSGTVNVTSNNSGTITITGNSPTVTNSAPTLSWGNPAVIGSVDGTELTVTMPANPNTNTTYSLTQDSTDGHKITLTPSSGTAQTITIPDNNDNYYHSTGTWSGLTYSADNTHANGTELKFTLPTGTSSTTVSRGDHTHTASLATDTGTSAITLAHGGKYKLTAGGSSVIFTMPTDNNSDTYIGSAAFADDTTANANSPVKMTLTTIGTNSDIEVIANIPKVSSSSAGVVPKGATVSSQSQSTKFLREDGTWAAPSYTTNTNTDTLVKQNALNGTNSGKAILISNYSWGTTSAGAAQEAYVPSKLGYNDYSGALYIGSTSKYATYSMTGASFKNNSNTYSTRLNSGTPTSSDVTITLPTSTGTLALTSQIPDAGTGLSKTGTTLNHSNSITAQTTQAVYPVEIDAQGHISAYGDAVTSMPASDVYSWAKASTKPSYTFSEIGSKPTTISGYGITDAYTKTEVNNLVASVFHYKGTKATVSALPTSGNTTGDVWHVTADGSEYVWNGSAWEELGTAVDLSGYAQLSGANFTGPVNFGDSVTADDLTTGTLVTTGNASFANNIQANTINGVAVGSSPKFTDTVTTVSTSGSGNAITAISASNGAITATKGSVGTVTKVSTGVGLTGGDVTTTGTIKAKLRSETALTNASAADTETAGRVYPVAVDKDGYLAVNVPWTDNNTHYTANLITGASATATANAANATTNSIFLNLIENSTVRNSHNIVGSGATTVSCDANGKITINSTDTTYTLSGLGGIGTINASGTAPLTLSASKSGTTVTISGSVASASTSAAGVVTTGTQSFKGDKTFLSDTFRIRNANNDNNQAGTNPWITQLNLGDGNYVTMTEYKDDHLAIRGSSILLSTATAPTVYSNDKTYSVGALVWYNKAYYRCTTAITTAEEWTAEHWTILPSSAIMSHSNFNPTIDNTYSLGTSAYRWSDVRTLKLNGTAIPDSPKFTDTVYTHPTYTSQSSGLYKITVDGTGHVSGATAVAKSDITGLGIPAQDTTYSTATSDTLGLVKIGYTQSGKNYPVQLSNGQMYVNVPWTNVNSSYLTSETDPVFTASAAYGITSADITAWNDVRSNYVSYANLPIQIEDNCSKSFFTLYVNGSTASLINDNNVAISFLLFTGRMMYGLETLWLQVLNNPSSLQDTQARLFTVTEVDMTTASVRLTSVDNGTIYTADLQDTGNGLTGTFSSQSIPTSISSSTTGISIADHSTTTIYGVTSDTTSVRGVKTGTNSTTTASKVTVGSHSTDYGVKSAGSGSFTQGSFSGGSGSFSATVTNHVLSFSHTHTAATHGADSHTHTAPTLGSKVPTVSADDVTVPIRADADTTVPIKDSATTTVVTSKTHTITDNGHTHTLS